MDTFRNRELLFDVRDEGPADGEVVALLHGFPQTSASWRDVVKPLHQAGFRTLCPDLRGYSAGARPKGAKHYELREMVGDIVALFEAAGVAKGHLAGHDWGGALAWEVAATRPDLVQCLTVFSTPHPAAMAWALRHSDQLRRSWHMVFFAIPKVPGFLTRQGLKRFGMKSLGIGKEFEREYLRVLAQPGALDAAMCWYRAALTRPSGSAAGKGKRVDIPTTYAWGNRDPYLGRAAAERTARYCSGPYRMVELDAGHWIPEKQPDLAAQLIVERAGVQ